MCGVSQQPRVQHPEPCIQTGMCMRARSYAHARTDTHACAHVYTHAYTHASTHTCTCTHTCTHSRPCTHMCTHTLAHSRTYEHIELVAGDGVIWRGDLRPPPSDDMVIVVWDGGVRGGERRLYQVQVTDACVHLQVNTIHRYLEGKLLQKRGQSET